ncbi:MAG TPA: MBL fold metallo-hydrolase [Terriglobales bacterium]|nr:MBL fold metallo-hydrolase [Terriglobales bacterium]
MKSLKVTILSTMLSDFEGIGEWGFAALLEADGRRILIDTGARPDTVSINAREMKVDLSDVKEVVLTHNHGDHAGGLLTLRREYAKKNPAALSVVHVGKGIFYPRPGRDGKESNATLLLRDEFEKGGGRFVEHDGFTELAPGVWLTGPIPRQYPEKNYPGRAKMRTAEGLVDDIIPEDQAIVVNTAKGLVVISGCGHAGIVNTATAAEKRYPGTPIHALIGGFHMFAATDQQVDWTAEKLKPLGVQNFIGAHCTGINTVFRLRDDLGLPRDAAVVGAVGASFVLGEGIHPGVIAK